MRRLVSLALLLVAACGPSSAQVKEARESSYNTDFPTVWNAVSAEMKQAFPEGIKKEDASAGYIESVWKSVGVVQDSTVGDSNQKANTMASSVGARDMWRMMAKIEEGGPPWKVAVDGEAALFRRDLSMLTPYKHGAIDEPAWVNGRIDALRLAIHERLKQYAVQSPAQKTP